MPHMHNVIGPWPQPTPLWVTKFMNIPLRRSIDFVFRSNSKWFLLSLIFIVRKLFYVTYWGKEWKLWIQSIIYIFVIGNISNFWLILSIFNFYWTWFQNMAHTLTLAINFGYLHLNFATWHPHSLEYLRQ